MLAPSEAGAPPPTARSRQSALWALPSPRLRPVRTIISGRGRRVPFVTRFRSGKPRPGEAPPLGEGESLWPGPRFHPRPRPSRDLPPPRHVPPRPVRLGDPRPRLVERHPRYGAPGSRRAVDGRRRDSARPVPASSSRRTLRAPRVPPTPPAPLPLPPPPSKGPCARAARPPSARPEKVTPPRSSPGWPLSSSSQRLFAGVAVIPTRKSAALPGHPVVPVGAARADACGFTASRRAAPGAATDWPPAPDPAVKAEIDRAAASLETALGAGNLKEAFLHVHPAAAPGAPRRLRAPPAPSFSASLASSQRGGSSSPRRAGPSTR